MSKIMQADLYGLQFGLATQQEQLGSTFEDSKGRIFRYVKYNDGSTIYGIQGQGTYGVGHTSTGDVAILWEVTCDNNGTGAVAADGRGIIIPKVVLDGEFCWIQESGPSLVDTYVKDGSDIDTGDYMIIDETTVIDGLFEEVSGNEDQARAVAMADHETDRFFARFTPTANFTEGGTMTGASTATGTIKKVFNRGSTQYAYLLTSVSGTFSASTEAMTGTPAGSGSTGAVGTLTDVIMKAGNSRLIIWK